MRIMVKSEKVSTEITTKGNAVHSQAAAVDTGDDFPMAFKVNVRENTPYKPGLYDLAPSCFRVGRFGGLELDPYNIRLIPVELARAPAAK
ncbi:MAG: single-stranded DNA-binding protein [Rudaea sp.]